VQIAVLVEGRDALLPSLLRCLKDRRLSALLVEEGGSALSYAESLMVSDQQVLNMRPPSCTGWNHRSRKCGRMDSDIL